MSLAPVDLPEPFREALECGDPGRVCDCDAEEAAALFGRGLARASVGRLDDARRDFEAARQALGDACDVELAMLDLQQRRPIQAVVDTVSQVLLRGDQNTPLAARAYHALGLAKAKLRETSEGVDALLKAAELYEKSGDRLGRARVYDTLGTMEAARGRLDCACHCYTMSLVDKSLLHDLYGMAITLGNLGRVHLRAGRYRDAIDCFHRDLEIARQLQDQRGIARMHDDLGRAYLGLEDYAQAERELTRCLGIAQEHGLQDLAFFGYKDLVYLRVAQHRLSEAEEALGAAQARLPSGAEPHLAHVLAVAEGNLLLARGDRRASDVLRAAVEALAAGQLPDFEISARVLLAEALLKEKRKAEAEACLLEGLRLAQSEGYARYLPVLNEVMAQLDLCEGLVEEEQRHVGMGPSLPNNSYVIRRQLGSGAFGDVFRVYDSRRGRDLVLKRLRLDGVYETDTRDQVIASARRELEAASRVRHPGVVRVLAIGSEPQGGFYVVQQYVPGQPLSARLDPQGCSDTAAVLQCVERIAEALHALHEAGVVHRDLKPDNIILTDDDRPVLVDFGVAHLEHSKAGMDQRLIGTLPYMAPEQATGKRVDHRADLYALGVTFFEWLAGVRPLRLRGPGLEEMIRDLVTRPPPLLSEFRPDTNPEVESLVMDLLAKQRRKRPRSASQVADRCRAIRQRYFAGSN